jgi:glycosyltransferase involved in cell wall biosynthesis
LLLSILIPVYNERAVVRRSLQAVLDAPLPEDLERELVIVDDCSRDGTWDILREIAASEPRIRLFRHEVNQGKGAAVRTAIGYAQGDFCLIQDADLEYDANEYPILMKPLLEGRADAVFGSRYLSGEQRRVLPYWHTQINQFLTFVSNIFSNINLTDMETCYKVFRTDLLKSIPIRSNRFGIEPELSMKCAKRRLRIYEVPISYHGRSYEEGKKIGWRDGLQALGVILKFWLIDDLYVAPEGRGALINLTRTPNYLKWITETIRPWLGDRILEIGAGDGTFAGRLMGRRTRYVAAEGDAIELHALRNRFLRTPNVVVEKWSPRKPEADPAWDGEFDSALCLNVLEGVPDPASTLRVLHRALRPGGSLVLLAPLGASLYGPVDRKMGQLRRFDLEPLRRLLGDAGFLIEECRTINKAGRLAWSLNNRIQSKGHLSKPQLKVFDKTLFLWKLLDRVLPWQGLSAIVRAQKAG